MSDEQALKNISTNVVRLRGQRSQYWLAKATGTYPANIARIESGDSMPGGGMLSRIAEALETTVDFLLSDHAKKNRRTG